MDGDTYSIMMHGCNSVRNHYMTTAALPFFFPHGEEIQVLSFKNLG